MRTWILPLGVGMGLTLILASLAGGCDGGSSDPVEQNCVDEVDNDSDGVTDCDDPDCASTLACGDIDTDDTDGGDTGDTGPVATPDLGEASTATIIGADDGAWTGFAIDGGVDVNGDGTPDMIVGAPKISCEDSNGNDMEEAGAAYVFFGPVTGSVNADDADITICGSRPDAQLGTWVGLSADMTADGNNDIVVSAPRDRSGRVFVLSGLAASSTPYIAEPGVEGSPVTVDIVGEGVEYHFGDTFDMAPLGNGSGTPALIIGSDAWSDQGAGSGGANLGRTYVFESPLDTEGQMRANRAETWFSGTVAGEDSGRSLAVGDFNGDGRRDLAIGALGTSFDGVPNGGAVYITWGDFTGSRYGLDDSDVTLESRAAEEGVGQSVRAAGDYNDDGIMDLVIGAHKASSNSGVAYIWFGSNAGWETTDTGSVDVALRGATANDNTGHSVDQLGDVTGDGVDDLVIGAINVSAQGASQRGAAYIIAGNSLTGAADIDRAAWATFLGDEGEEVAGHRVRGVGDMTGDGQPDLMIGAYRKDRLTGAAYLLAGPIAEQE